MKNKVSWTNEQEFAVARELVNLRLSDPFEFTGRLLQKAMHKTLPEDQWRALASINQVPGVVKKVTSLWLEKVTQPEAKQSQPQIVTIEVPAPIDYTKLYEQLDGPTLAAFAFGKIERMLSQLTVSKTSSEASPLATVVKPLSIIAAATAKPKLPRVAILTLPGQHSDIREKVNGLSEKLDIRYLDSERSTNDAQIARVDYAIVLSATGHHNWNKAKEYLPSDRVFFVEGISRAVQKLYDLAAMQK